jgi:elongator complex protein 1
LYLNVSNILVFKMAGNKLRALECFKSIGLFIPSMTLAHQLYSDNADILATAEELVDILIEQSQYSDAAQLYLEYLEDPENSVKMFCLASQWVKAERVCARYGIDVLCVLDALVSSCATLNKLIKSSIETFLKQAERLRVVRATRLAKAFTIGEIDDRLDNIDIMSDTSSMATTRTGFSGASDRSSRTTRSRRKMERKIYSGRKGGIFELEFLENSIKNAVIKSNGLSGMI